MPRNAAGSRTIFVLGMSARLPAGRESADAAGKKEQALLRPLSEYDLGSSWSFMIIARSREIIEPTPFVCSELAWIVLEVGALQQSSRIRRC